MGFWSELGNAIKEAGADALKQTGLTLGIAYTTSDRELLAMYDKVEDYFFDRDENEEQDEEYEQYMQMKRCLETVLKTRGYRPRTTFVFKEKDTD